MAWRLGLRWTMRIWSWVSVETALCPRAHTNLRVWLLMASTGQTSATAQRLKDQREIKTTVYLLKWNCLLWVFYNDAFTEPHLFMVQHQKGQLVSFDLSNRFNGVLIQPVRAMYLICIYLQGFSNASVLFSLRTFAEITDCTRMICVHVLQYSFIKWIFPAFFPDGINVH